MSDALARRALEPARRTAILARTRGILNQNFPIIAQWLDGHSGLFSYAPPDAGAIVYARYHHAINSTELVTRLRQEKSVLIVPGDHFGMDGYLRIGFGDEPSYLRQALDRVAQMLADIADCGVRIADSQSAIESAIRSPQSAIRMTFDLILIGFGNVAKRFVALLDEQQTALARRSWPDDARGRHRDAGAMDRHMPPAV